ncbi:MAG: PEP-CTERM sorting domain-containing protein [Candidatus Omnitrophica bacterium]|nr:PEP-CTERM sorting domain-containing protein [Candidatus Omnitrophota bacterium]
MRERVVTAVITIFASVLLVSPGAYAGDLFVTGHDSDEHANEDYMSAGLDFLLFGAAATPADRAGKTIALLDNSGGSSAVTALNGVGWSATLLDTDLDFSSAFDVNAYDAIMTASGGSNTLRTQLVGATPSFTSYFNAGGALYINTDQGIGQSWYDFVPQFGTTTNNTISISGAFSPTAAGLGIGLTDPIVDADITHSFYTGVDTSLFTIFEVTDPQFFQDPEHPLPVAFGTRNVRIGDGGFVAGDPVIPEPTSLLLFGLGTLSAVGVRRRRKAT